ncbi:urea carboxylase-associated family protein [Nonomuraea sp. NPDC049480]|uniref:urea carboxylase-associated family protein n=1 Tax=Nonomuraea sp. NPDC049480 TaxID=3364353 RepID=UPI0037A8A96A
MRAETRTIVPAREGRAVRVTAGQRVSVVDLEGGQVGDVFAFVPAATLTEHLSAAHTRAHANRLFPAVGQQFVTDRRRPILTLIADTSPGWHDMLIPACDQARYAALGAKNGHASCADNLDRALTALGLSVPFTPQPVNVFMAPHSGPRHQPQSNAEQSSLLYVVARLVISVSDNDRLSTLAESITEPQVSTVDNSCRKSMSVNGAWSRFRQRSSATRGSVPPTRTPTTRSTRCCARASTAMPSIWTRPVAQRLLGPASTWSSSCCAKATR